MSDYVCTHELLVQEDGWVVPTCMCLGSFGRKDLMTRTLNIKDFSWTPSGEVCIVTSGVPLKLPKEK